MRDTTENFEGSDYQGLFGRSTGQIKNVGLVNADIRGKDYTGGLAGYAGGQITNSYSTGNVSGRDWTGGLAGYAYAQITNSYSTGSVSGGNYTGGLAGYARSTITNSYSTGTVSGGEYTGGLAGYASSTITNSYSTGSVSGGQYTGGLAGQTYSQITNSYSTGNVSGGNYTGGLAGRANNTITNSYSTGTVSGGDSTGGLAGQANYAITNSYAKGNVQGSGKFTGGLIGQIKKTSGSLTYNQIAAFGQVTGGEATGSLVGGAVTGTSGALTFTNAQARSQGLDAVGGEYKDESTLNPRNINTWNSAITQVEMPFAELQLQVGINGDTSSQVAVDTSFKLALDVSDIKSASAYNSIQTFLDSLSEKATQLGAVSNRLESALESTTTQINNLTSSLSTIKDADVAKESSQYIRNQILQQASATLLATANQTPSIALQLL